MLKSICKLILQRIFGLKNYLYLFSIFIIKKLPWDKKEKDFMFFLNLIPNSGILLDIGANIGVMTYYLATKKPSAQVISFEPLELNYTNIERIQKKYKLTNVELRKIALGNENGTVSMVLPVLNSVKMHGLSHVKHESIDVFNEGQEYTVPIKKLDDLLKLNTNQPVNAIKIDVENFEYFALKGGSEIIKTHQPIIYAELWEGDNRDKTIELLISIGYSVKVVQKNKLIDYNNQEKQNFIFIPQNKQL